MGERERQSRQALNARLVSRPMFDGGCRDPRWASPATVQLEAAWDNTNPAWANYIPSLGTPRHYAAIDQIEEHVKRPITSDGWRLARKLEDRLHVAAPPAHRKKVSPTIFTNSMTWNRRHCKSLPAVCCAALLLPCLLSCSSSSSSSSISCYHNPPPACPSHLIQSSVWL